MGTSLKKSNQVDASQWLPFGKLDAAYKGVERPEAEDKRGWLIVPNVSKAICVCARV